MIYLDYQATTPVAPEVAAAMQPWIAEKFANPHSPSRWGREAAAAIEVARKQVEQAIGLPGGKSGIHRQRDRSAELGAQGDDGEGSGKPQPHRDRRHRACGSARHVRMAGRAEAMTSRACRSTLTD